MMYKTHLKIGQTLYIASLPILTKVGIMPDIVNTVKTGDTTSIALTAVTFGASAYVGFKAATWGAGAPDIDHPTSIPARENPIIHKILKSFGVKHRGRFSHSIDSMTLVFMMMYLAVVGIFNYFEIPQGNIGNAVIFLENLLKVWVVSAYVGVLTHLFADSLTKSGIRVLFFLPPVKLVGTKMNVAVISMVAVVLFGVVPNIFSKGLELEIIVTAIIGMLVAFVFSGYVYDYVNGKSKAKKIMKIGSVIIFTGILIGVNIVDFSGIYQYVVVKQTIMIIAISGLVTSLLPGIDFFTTGNDSTWENLVRGAFDKLLPISFVIVPLIMIMG